MADKQTIKRGILAAMAALVGLGVAIVAWVWIAPCWLGGCAPLDDMAEYQAEGSQLLDVNGKPFGTLATVNRRVVPLDSLPEHLTRAFVAVEDRRFYDHGGLDVTRVFGALLKNVQAGGVAEGGSTITMQLARNLFPEWLPYQERSFRRKLLEARVARQIERNFSKQKILELYLNHIYLGSGAYGIEAAAHEYFGKSASKLSLAESATLAGLPKAPSDLNPKQSPERARERRDLILGLMAQEGYITQEQAREARQTELEVVNAESGPAAQRGSYFVEKVRREMAERVGNRFYTAGLKIHTTLDLQAQRAAEEELARQLDAIEAGRFGGFRHPTYPEAKRRSKRTGQTPYLQGAVVLMDAATGEIRALVGGRDYEDSKFDRATQALRQPGSAFKPFVYAAALERYGSPIERFEDSPVRLVLSGGKVWEPRNYTGRYEGPMTMREALTRSKNTITVRLAQEVGMDQVIENARALGVTSNIQAVPATALGSAEVRPIELVQAYAAFGNGGNRVEPHFIRKIVDRRGQTLWESPRRAEPAMDPAVAFVLTSMMQDVVNRGTGTGARAAGLRVPAAGKTGTTNAATDVWFVGYTPDLVGGVWMGFDNPRTIVRGASGGTLAAPVWGRIMQRVYQSRPAPAAWKPPSGVTSAEVEVGTGRVVTPSCPAAGPTYTEYFVNGAPPTDTCLPPTQYASLPGDSAWVDEEWSPQGDTLGGSLPEGVDWPELAELRRRMRVGEEAGEGTVDTAVAEPLPAEPRAPRNPRPTPADPARPRPAQPPVLGRPTPRDTATPPPPPDTVSGGAAGVGRPSGNI